jgi:hypothetical protein
MMNNYRKAGRYAAAALLLGHVAAAAPVLEGPPPRAITDPKSLTSVALPGAVAVPIADLNLTGRHNLWKVAREHGDSGGRGRLQLVYQADRRLAGAVADPHRGFARRPQPRMRTNRKSLICTPVSWMKGLWKAWV